jgi:small subunit ribosomal protein S6
VSAYEVIVILDPALPEDGIEAEIGAIREIVAKRGGGVAEVQRWGKKRLAYEVKKRRDGQYLFMKVNAPPAVVADVARYARITETVLKGIVFRTEGPRKVRFKAKTPRTREAVGATAREGGDGELQ